MNARIFIGSFLSIIGVPGTGLGILFLAAAKGDPSRKMTGVILIICSILFLFSGIFLFLKGMAMRPAGIRSRLLKLAKHNNGEVFPEEITGTLGDSDAVKAEINTFLRSGLAKEFQREGRKIYIFSDFQHHLILKACPYCGNDYPVREDIEQCPSCGGDLKLNKKASSPGDEPYYMDS